MGGHFQQRIAELAIHRQQGLQGRAILRIDQVGFVQQQQRGNPGVFGRHQIAVDQVRVRLWQWRKHNHNQVDVGRHWLELAAAVRPAQLGVARQLRDYHADALVAGTPDYLVAGYQSRQVGAQVAATYLAGQFAIQRLDFHLNAEVGNHQAQLLGAEITAFEGVEGVRFTFGRTGGAVFLNLLDTPVLPAVELAFGHGVSKWGVRQENKQVVEKRSERRSGKANSAEKAQFTGVNEHFEAEFNAAQPSAVAFQWPV